ncbi:hypothetical protein BDR26DRAFT_866039 [Obelidium mucronatum]|nr:hypothetical protein BDR26DRAFT_866039 [Obelidium mucronatum]
MTASNHAAPVRANAVDYAALARAAASLRFPAPFDMLVTLVGGVITLCADLRQNREDAHRLLQTAVALANTLAALPPRNSDSDVAAHAKRLSDTLGKIHEYLGKEKEKEKRSFFKLVFTKLHQAATTSQIKLQIAQFDKCVACSSFLGLTSFLSIPPRRDLQVEIASLTASVAVKLLTHAQTGGFNDAQMKQLIGAFRSEDAGYSRMIKEVLAKIAEKNPQPQQKRETIALAAYLVRPELPQKRRRVLECHFCRKYSILSRVNANPIWCTLFVSIFLFFLS